jgi:hypothetical protein
MIGCYIIQRSYSPELTSAVRAIEFTEPAPSGT